MADGLFHRRESHPAPLDLDAIVRETVEYAHPEQGPNLAVPATWTIEDRDQPWATLVFTGTVRRADGTDAAWTLRRRIPAQRIEAPRLVSAVEKALVDLHVMVADQQRHGDTFTEPVPATPVPAAHARRRR